MKLRTKSRLLIMLLIVFSGVSLSQQPVNRVPTYNWTGLTIRDLKIDSKNIHMALSEIASSCNVPIGLEVSPKDDLLNGVKVSLDVKEGRLDYVLNSIVSQNPLYTWAADNGVINVFPKDPSRDLLLKKLLETDIGEISLRKGISRFNFREYVTEKEEIKRVLDSENISPENQVFSSRDIRPLGSNFSLNTENVTLRSLLNSVVKSSETKYWIINRIGEKRQYLLLNL